jgi:hypothetical protein
MRNIALISLLALIALAVTGCGPGPIVADADAEPGAAAPAVQHEDTQTGNPAMERTPVSSQ